MRNRHLPLVKLPSSLDLTLFLLREELKSAHLFKGLEALSLHDCFYQPHLGSAILAQMGFGEVPDELFNYYSSLIDKHSAGLEEDMESLTKNALEVYYQMVSEKKRREERVA